MDSQPVTPTLDKILEHREEADALGAFLDWLQYEKKYFLGEFNPDDPNDELTIVHLNPEDILADYFGIDLAAADRERQALLEWIRSSSSAA